MLERLLSGFPRLFQAGMGARVSTWLMARIVSSLGGLGIVSSVGLRSIVIESVRLGDKSYIEIARKFPFAHYVEEMLAFAPGGKWHKKAVPMDQLGPRGELARRLTTIATFMEVSLAKEGHSGVVGVNIMWKLTLTVLPTIYGAMLAGVDALICGAGVPMELPSIESRIRAGQDLCYSPLYGTTTSVSLHIDEEAALLLQGVARPLFIPILSNFVFCRKIKDNWEANYGFPPDFFILEDHQAGGHNAPPRNKVAHTDEKDGIEAYFDDVLKLGVPVIVAGAFPHGGTSEDLLYCQSKGAYGIQAGSRFALDTESGMLPWIRHAILEGNRNGTTEIVTSYEASPTGYPIKRVSLPDTLSDEAVYESVPRSCKYGYLRQFHQKAGEAEGVGALVCPAMPVELYQKLTGLPMERCAEICKGKVCLCKALTATIGLVDSPPFVTLGLSGAIPKEEETSRQIVEEILTPQYVAEREIQLRTG